MARTRTRTRTAGISKIAGARRTTYEARWRATDPATGNRQEFSASFPTLELAEAHLIHQQSANRTGSFVTPTAGKRTFGEVFEGWIVSKPRKARTVSGYRNVYDTWLSAWAHRPVASLGYADVRAVMNQVTEAGRKPQTAHNVFTIINATLTEAVYEGCLAVNPATRFRGKLPSAGRTRDPNPLSAPHVSALAQAMSSDLYRLFVTFAAWSGMRKAELLGLRVQDVHVLNAEAQVIQTVHWMKGGTWRVDTPKSKQSANRRVPLPPTLAKEISAYVSAHGLAADAYVFAEADGAPLRYDAFYQRVYKPTARRLGFPMLRIHDLRHSFAALKLGQGYGLHQIKEWMGHSTIVVTIDLYGRLVPGDDTARRAADDAAFLAAAPTAPVTQLRPANAS